jgi:hypothetical protein
MLVHRAQVLLPKVHMQAAATVRETWRPCGTSYPAGVIWYILGLSRPYLVCFASLATYSRINSIHEAWNQHTLLYLPW